ncbi:MAG TPA: SurA N-terminal domain-containing protein, partial [Candidatus Syntrophosphaera sp.]|nr:SurA N-terminal domain-containing protein [Candidatus Syntrophosphaera sp.]
MKKHFIKIIPLIVLALFTTSINGAQNNPELAGKINGTPIPYNEFIQELLLNYYNFQYENNRAPDSREKELIKRQTWEQKTMYVILKDYYKKYNIKVTAEETIEYLKNNPPETLKKSPLFMTDGKFDQKIYVQSLLYDTPYNLKPYRDRYQTYLIPNLKLQDYIIQDELLTSSERKLITKILQSSANIKWTILDTKDITPYITEEEIQIYYQKHLSD